MNDICLFIVRYVLVDEKYDYGPMTMTSTPKKKKPRKHALTPESKQRNEPSSKRHQISEGYTSATCQFKVGNSSFIFSFTFFYNKRRFRFKPKFFFYYFLNFIITKLISDN